jgi:diguanylate cyclase (GGDEF)-like protein
MAFPEDALHANSTSRSTHVPRLTRGQTLVVLCGAIGLAVAILAPANVVRDLCITGSVGLLAIVVGGTTFGSRRLFTLPLHLLGSQHRHRDPLSGLPNRLAFQRQLRACVASSEGSTDVFALFYVDLEGVRDVNDMQGSQAGDRLIAAAAARLAGIMGEGDVLARIGGDEFAIISKRCGDRAAAGRFALDILGVMKKPFDVKGRQTRADASIGIALSSHDPACSNTLMRSADAALRRAKKAGRGSFEFFDRVQDGQARDERALAAALRTAIDQDALLMHYQPIIAADTLQIRGVEALVRWQHPERGLLTPASFIPLAEACGMMPAIGEWTLRRACREARRWPGLRIAVNVSPAQFRDADFVATVAHVLKETGFDPNRLEIELTESVIIDDAEQAERCMVELRAMGIRLAIDDFGTGYSSLIYLRRFAFDKMKIDKSFVQILDETGEGAVIIDAIVRLGQALGLTITAEGIETVQQQTYLRALKCDEFQGYLYSPPISADDIDALISTKRFGDEALQPRHDPIKSVA